MIVKLLLVLIFSYCANKNRFESNNTTPNICITNQTESTHHKFIYEVFRQAVIVKEDSGILENKYSFKIQKIDDLKGIKLYFDKCTVFNDSKQFQELKSVVWYEEALLIKNTYFVFNNYIIIYDFFKNNLMTCDFIDKNDYILEQIRIYEKSEYFRKADKSSSILYSLKSSSN